MKDIPSKISFGDLVGRDKKQAQKSEKFQKKLESYDKPDTDQKISLSHNYLYGFQRNEFEGINPLVEKSFMLDKATPKQVYKFKKQKAVEKFQRHFMDVGSLAVQIVCLSERILQVLEHVKNNKKDSNGIRKIQEVSQRRNRLLNALRVQEPNKYIWIIREYGIPQSQRRLDKMKLIPLPSHTHNGGSKRRNFIPNDNLKSIKNPQILK